MKQRKKVSSLNIKSRRLLHTVQKIQEGQKERGIWTKTYIDRIKEEIVVIQYHGFENYYLMVQDYTNYAKKVGIKLGPGHGSGCNCLVNYALHITDVYLVIFDLDFRRFLRIDKKKLPDIVLDIET